MYRSWARKADDDDEEEEEKEKKIPVPDRFSIKGVMQGRYAHNRFPEDKEYVLKIADLFLNLHEKQILAKLLGYDNYKSIEFTPEEGQILLSRATPDFLMGTRETSEKEQIGFPFLQLYDFIMTFEEVLAHIRGLQVQVNNLDELGDPANKEILRQQIMADNGQPWSIYEKTGGATSNMVNGIDEYAGLVVGSNSIYESREIPPDALAAIGGGAAKADGKVADALKEAGKPALVAPPQAPAAKAAGKQLQAAFYVWTKTPYERACDEAFYCGFEIQNAILAMAQGLFTIHVTKANAWEITTDGKEGKLDNKSNIPQGRWINAFSGPVAYHADAYKAESLALMQPKYIKIEDYPQNHFARFHSGYFHSPTKLYGDWEKLKYDLVQHKHDGDGGAIGLRLFVVGPGDATLPLTDFAKDPIPKEDIASIHLPELSMKLVRRVMAQQTTHPIHVCPRLADAWLESKAWQYIVDMWNRLKSLFTSKQKISTLGIRPDSMDDILAIQDKISNMTGKTSCSKGFVTVFRDHQGKPVPLDKAIYIGDDQVPKIDVGLVDHKQTTCVPEMDAPRLPDSVLKRFLGAGGISAPQKPFLKEGKVYGDMENSPDEVMLNPIMKHPKKGPVKEVPLTKVKVAEALAEEEEDGEEEEEEDGKFKAKIVGFDVGRLMKDRAIRDSLKPAPAKDYEAIVQTDMADNRGRPIYQTSDGGLFKLVQGRRVWVSKTARKTVFQ